MSFKTTTEIINVYSLWPKDFTLANYVTIFTDSTWYMGYVNSITYSVFNTIISVSAALPAAYAFSRYKFLGDKHLFFWLLTNRMAPPAVFALPFFQFYSSINLFDTHIAIALSHCLFNIPLAVWILEGFMSAVPKELDETAYVDGYSFGRFFFKIFVIFSPIPIDISFSRSCKNKEFIPDRTMSSLLNSSHSKPAFRYMVLSFGLFTSIYSASITFCSSCVLTPFHAIL